MAKWDKGTLLFAGFFFILGLLALLTGSAAAVFQMFGSALACLYFARPITDKDIEKIRKEVAKS